MNFPQFHASEKLYIATLIRLMSDPRLTAHSMIFFFTTCSFTVHVHNIDGTSGFSKTVRTCHWCLLFIMVLKYNRNCFLEFGGNTIM